jgi:hypothetical protein
MGKSIHSIRARSLTTAPSLTERMNFRLVILWRVALQHGPPPLHQPSHTLQESAFSVHCSSSERRTVSQLFVSPQGTTPLRNDEELTPRVALLTARLHLDSPSLTERGVHFWRPLSPIPSGDCPGLASYLRLHAYAVLELFAPDGARRILKAGNHHSPALGRSFMKCLGGNPFNIRGEHVLESLVDRRALFALALE